MAKIQKKIETTIPFNSIFLFSTQRLSIREPPNYLPTEATEPTEVSGARYSPTDCTDMHRLGGYGILPYSRSHQTIFPQNAPNSQKRLAENILPQIALIFTDVLSGGAAVSAAPTKQSGTNITILPQIAKNL